MIPPLDDQNPKYLISTQSEIDAQLAEIEKSKKEWSKSFPGQNASHIHKVHWLDKMVTAHRDDPGNQKLFDPNDVLKLILRDAASTPVELQLVVRSDMLEHFSVSSLGPSNVYGEVNTKTNGTSAPDPTSAPMQDEPVVEAAKHVKQDDSAATNVKSDKPSDTATEKVSEEQNKITTEDNATPTTAADIVASAGAGEVEEMRIDEPPALVIEKPSAADSMQDVAAEAVKTDGNENAGNTAPETSDVVVKNKEAAIEAPTTEAATTAAPKVEPSTDVEMTDKSTTEKTTEDANTATVPVSKTDVALQESGENSGKSDQPAAPIEVQTEQEEKSSETPVDQPGKTGDKVEKEKAHDAHPGTTEQPTEEKPSLVVIARELVNHNTRTDVIVPKLLRSVGLPIDATVRCVPAVDGTSAKYNENLSEFVMEMVSVPSTNGGSVVALQVESKDAEYSDLQRTCWERALTCSGDNEHSFMVVEKDSSASSGAPPSAETHDVVWFSKRHAHERCRKHLQHGTGEIDAIRKRFKDGGVDAANLMLKMVQAELSYVKRISGENQWMTKLSSLLALTDEVYRSSEFISICTKPEEAVRTIIEMGEYWRISILKHGAHTDVELGINPPGETDGARSRNALHTLLKKVQARLESIIFNESSDDPAFKIFFSAVPGKPRIRSPTPSASPPPAVVSLGTPAVTPAPRGRCPHDSAGVPMTWDGVNALWRSSTNPNETRVPKIRTPKANNVQATATPIAPSNVLLPAEQMQSSVSGIVPAATDGKQDGLDSQQPAAPCSNISIDNASVNSTANVGAIVRQNSKGGKQRPGGRPPHDSQGKSMQWDAIVGIWRSPSNPDETKIPGTPKKMQPQTANVESASVAGSTVAQPMQIDVPSANQEVVQSKKDVAQQAVDAPNMNLTITPLKGNEIANPPKSSLNTVVTMTPFSIDPSTHSRPKHSQAQTPRKRPAPEQTPDPSSMFTPPPRGRAPLDSKGESMNWDGNAGLWRSTSDPEETKISKSVQPRRTSPNAGRTAKAPRAEPSQAIPMEIAPAAPVQQTSRPVAPVPSPISSEGQQTYLRPGGRPPNDSTGRPMDWDSNVGVWKSLHVEGEVKQPKTAPKIAKSPIEEAPAASEAEVSEAEAKAEEIECPKKEDEIMTDTNKEEGCVQEKRTLTMRPGGRAPNDSTGVGMVWDGVQAIWRSLNNANETRKPNVSAWKYSGGGPVVDSDDVPVRISEQTEEESSKSPRTPKKTDSKEEGDVVPTTPRPRGKPPNDSRGQVMQWDAVNGRWFSTHVDGETRTPKSKTPAKVASEPIVEPLRTNGESVETKEPQSASKEKGEELEENEQSAPTVESTMRPKGRAPNDSSGKSMVWDVGHHCWRSTTNLSETKPPKAEAGGSGDGEAGTSTKGINRPKGRAPYDSKGAPMNWDSEAGVWKSTHNPEEVKTPKKVSG